MTGHFHPSHFLVVVVAITSGSVAWPATVQGQDGELHRLRSSDSSIGTLMDYGIAHSPTFRRLAASVEASNAIVYVEPGECARHVPACLAMWMKSSGGHRFLRVVLDRKRLDSGTRLLAAVGHELQHVIEVLSEPSTTNGTAMYFFFKRHEPVEGNTFETTAAIHSGLAVENELEQEAKKGSRFQAPKGNGQRH
jgi:hypothetical protein